MDNSPTDFRLVDTYGRRVSKDGVVDPRGVPIATSHAHQNGLVAGFGGDRYLILMLMNNPGTPFSCSSGCLWGRLFE